MKQVQRNSGFTLVELLVVIGIISLLISILLPALNKARNQARLLTCANNLRTLGQTLYVYAANNNGYFTPFVVKGLESITTKGAGSPAGSPDWVYRNAFNNATLPINTYDPNFVTSNYFPWTRNNTNGNGFYNMLYPRLIRNPEFFYCPIAKAFYEGSFAGQTSGRFYPDSWTGSDQQIRAGYNVNLIASSGKTQFIPQVTNSVQGGNAIVYKCFRMGTKNSSGRAIAWDIGTKSSSPYWANHPRRSDANFAADQYQLFLDGHVEYVRATDSAWKDGT